MKRSPSKKPDLTEMVKVRTPRDYPWRVLDKLVDDLSCSLKEDDVKKVKGVIRKRDFSEYLLLSEAWGPQCIDPCGFSVEETFAKYQASALLKKFQFPTDRQARRDTAYKKFLAAEEACLAFNQHGAKQLAFLTDPLELSCYTYAREFLSRLLGETLPSADKLTEWSRHGPGANLDTQERRVSLYDKYSAWPYSCTSGALRFAREAIEADERWLGALEDDYRRKNGIEPWRILNRETFWSDVLHVVPGNRITFVPKNSQTDRSIAIEPCMNLYLQLGVDGFIRRRLKRYGVDLDDQRKNQKLAWEGSKYWTGEDPYVTLDLAAASDTISLELCRLLLPPQWYSYLIRLRSPVGDCEGETLQYQKISSMGNGYTFALESAIFASVLYAAEMELRGSFDRDKVAVFGDDLITRRSASTLVVRMLNLFGFSLNPEKSFITGPFRESCGADWLGGALVRPIFLTSNPSTVMELWNDANRLSRVLSLRYTGFEFEASRLIDSWIPPAFANVVGPLSDESFDSCRHVPTPVGKYKNGLRKIRYLVAIPKRLKGDNFFYRKLMHTLRSSAAPQQFAPLKWGGLKLSNVGGRFTVTKAGSVTVSESSSSVSIWQNEYNECDPMDLWVPG